MQPPSASRVLTREEFLRNLKESKLLPGEGLAGLLSSGAGATDAAGSGVARSLMAAGILTAYQIEAISERRFGDLRIGSYEILERIGTGGMGTVYKARHRRMKRLVAIKVLQPNLCADLSFIKRFQREVETAARLSHPNVVMAFDAGEAEAGHFLVMEYVNGLDLATSVQKNGVFSAPEAAQAILQAARGLEYAHGQQVVHRDIKPANLLRDESGVVKVADLGLARFNLDRPNASSLTSAGVILGTADYMSPEQALDCGTIDHRADIYSLGCTLWFLLTGQPLYRAESLMALLLKHREAPIPSLRAQRPTISLMLEDLFRKMVAKAPENRIQSMSDVIRALEPEAAAASPGRGPEVLPAFAPPPSAVASPPSLRGAVRPPAGDAPTRAVPAPSSTTAARSQAEEAVTLLLVEPSRTQAVIIRKYLQDLGIEPLDVVPSGAAALAAMQTTLPRVIISTLHLKDMTGVQLAQQSQAVYGARAPGFLLISSQAESQDAGSLSAAGQVALLLKPFTLEQLAEGIRLVASRPAPPAAAGPPTHDATLLKAGTVPPRPLAPSATGGRRRGQLKVLLGSNGEAARAHMRQVLQAQGFAKVVAVGDGVQGVAAVTNDTYDLVIVEDNMPSLDVSALIDFLRQNGPATLPIVVVTADAGAQAREDWQRHGVMVLNDTSFPADAVKDLLDRFFP